MLVKAVGNSKAYRAVGMANHRIHIRIIIPCQCAIGANSDLVDYGGERAYKQFLLRLERIIL